MFNFKDVACDNFLVSSNVFVWKQPTWNLNKEVKTTNLKFKSGCWKVLIFLPSLYSPSLERISTVNEMTPLNFTFERYR